MAFYSNRLYASGGFDGTINSLPNTIGDAGGTNAKRILAIDIDSSTTVTGNFTDGPNNYNSIYLPFTETYVNLTQLPNNRWTIVSASSSIIKS